MIFIFSVHFLWTELWSFINMVLFYAHQELFYLTNEG